MTSGSYNGIYLGGVSPYQVVSADFNDDGIPDLVVAATCSAPFFPTCPASNANAVAVYLGKGDGSFKAPIFSLPLPGSLRSIAVADFNHDGKPDVVAVADHCTLSSCYAYEGSVTILLSNGDGTLSDSHQYALNGTALQANTVTTADLSGNGYPDVIVGVACYSSNCSAGAIAVFPGDGTGKLGNAAYYKTIGNGAITPVVSDFTGDGQLDIIATVGTASAGHSLAVLAGKGDGTFSATPVLTPLPLTVPQGLVTADFNGDGKSDLAFLALTQIGGGSATSSSVAVLFGKGDGTFQAPVHYALSYPLPQDGLAPVLQSLAVAQLSSGTRADLVVGTEAAGYSTNFATVLLNNGTGAFYVLPSYPVGQFDTTSIAIADYNQDGKQDIVFTSPCSQTDPVNDFDHAIHCADGAITVLLGTGNGSLQAELPAKLTINPYLQVLADMNNDGVPDMVGVSGGSVTVALGTGGGTFLPAIAYPASPGDGGLAVADVNGDGHLDVIVSGNETIVSGNGQLTSIPQLAILLGSKDGSLSLPLIHRLVNFTSAPPVVGDFAGNGKLGIAVLDGQGVGILLGNGDGTFKREVVTRTTEINPNNLAAGDFNHDGKDDLAVAGQLPYPNVGITVLLSNGDGTLSVKPNPDGDPSTNYLSTCNGQSACTFPASYPTFGIATLQALPITTADINGDGILDLVIANHCRINDPTCSTGNLLWLYGLGDGTFNLASPGGPSQQLGDANYVGVTVADVNGDRRPDVVASTASGVAVYLAPFTSPGTIYATSGRSGPFVPSIGDLNRDGGPDIAIANGSLVEVLLNRAGQPVESSPGTIYFPAEPVGTAAPLEEVTIKSTGGAPLTLNSFTISGPGAASYSIAGQTCGAMLAADASCTISVKFAPTQKGLLLATISIVDNAGNSPQQIALRGGGK